jgi:uncharacterized protein (TIGR03067 family)
VLFIGAAQEGTDAEKLQGTWTITLAEKHGAKQPEEKLKDLRVVIEGDSMCFKTGGQDGERATIKLDPSKTPKAIDFLPVVADKEKKPSLGIYELREDTLKLCWRKEGGERPTEFATKADDRDLVLMILKREKKD